LTYDADFTIDSLDPAAASSEVDGMILQNLFEPLLWYNGSNPTEVIPWLAQSYTSSPDGMTYNFTLRSGINFTDGEPLNSSAIYFSFNRQLMGDGSTPTTHATQQAWLFQQLLNTSLSTYLGKPQTYSPTYANDVLAQNFVQITGPLTFTLHLMHPNSAFPYLFGGLWAYVLAPNYVMQQDLMLWNKSSAGYTLPFPNLSGNETNRMHQYLLDMASTCNSGITPSGCGQSSLFSPSGKVLAGTGPYILSSYSPSSNNIVFTANPNYWGGPYVAKITPTIKTININYVPSQATREIDLQNAAKSGQPYTIDLNGGNLYDLVSRSAWLGNSTIQSIIPGISVYGPYQQYTTNYLNFASNVTNTFSGSYYSFQPFADIRFRLAFGDSVNMSAINDNSGNGLGRVATQLLPPGIPPSGAFNSSILPAYNFNLTAVQNLLLDAMLHPITHFTFFNGTSETSGIFNNSFGCSQLGSNGQCSNPKPQTIQEYYPSGDTLDGSIMNQIAIAVNNVSSTYNMGLTVVVVPEAIGQMFTQAFSDHLYFSWSGYVDDYPWAGDFVVGEIGGGGQQTLFYGWNYTSLTNVFKTVVGEQSSGNNSALLSTLNTGMQLLNSKVLQIWTFNPLTTNGAGSSAVAPFTSNVHGYYFNPSLYGTYFAALYIS